MPTAEKSTREKVQELFDKGKEPKDIAEAIGMTKASVYGHIRKIQESRGIAPRGRGRPPKVQTNGDTPTETKPAPATRKAPPKGDAEKPKAAKAQTNGHTTTAEFPTVKAAIEQELSQARRAVVKLEKMLATFES